MPLDPRARRWLALVEAASKSSEEDEVVRLRRATSSLADFGAPPSAVDRRDWAIDAPGRRLPARLYAPAGAGEATLPGLVYFHGGGLVSGGLESHDALCAELASRASCRLVAIDYRLGPEHRFPAAHDDAREALRVVSAAAKALAIDPARLGIGGDSAGGGLATTAALEAGVPLKLLFLLCPVLDPLAREPSRFELARGYLIEEATLERYWALYQTEGLSPDDPRVAPLRGANLSALPPTRIHSAEFDPLKGEGEALAQAIVAAGGWARCSEHPGLIHHFYGLTGVIPAAKDALAKISADLAEGLQ